MRCASCEWNHDGLVGDLLTHRDETGHGVFHGSDNTYIDVSGLSGDEEIEVSHAR
jgi:hypothetical protein